MFTIQSTQHRQGFMQSAIIGAASDRPWSDDFGGMSLVAAPSLNVSIEGKSYNKCIEKL